MLLFLYHITKPETSKPCSTSVCMDTRKIQQAFLHSGFKYLKVELEANVDPDNYPRETSCENCSEGMIDCGDCDGNGRVHPECAPCDGTGWAITNGKMGGKVECRDCGGSGRVEEDCPSCQGEGYYSCTDCSGGYVSSNEWEEGYCDDFEQRFRDELHGIEQRFVYLRVYHDGSVDTECTLTLRVDYLDKLPDIIKAFQATCRHFGRCDTENAGMHITLLEGYRYPRQSRLNQEKLANYKKHVSKLLLALVYLGSCGDMTRSFVFRDMRISDHTKYSAIYTHGDTCLEFRLFDTCYGKPETVFDYLAVIAKTLKFYTANPKKAVALRDAVSIAQSNTILNKHHCGGYAQLADIYNTRESRTRLFRELSHLVGEKGRKILSDISCLSPCAMSAELFTMLKYV